MLRVSAMKLVLATRNRHKAQEIRDFFRDFPVSIFLLEEADPIDLKEEGKTLQENALMKARGVASAKGEWALADDTGLFVTVLGGEPGIFSARYAGEGATFEENQKKLLEKLKGVSPAERGAYFSCAIALVHPDGREVTVEGRLEGRIVEEPKGNQGFGYDPIFFLPDRGLTLAELSLEEKNKISHRGKALVKVRHILQELMALENRK